MFSRGMERRLPQLVSHQSHAVNGQFDNCLICIFIDDVASSTACSRLHEPETLYDDAVASEELTVGQSHEYCVYAYSRTSIVWAEDEALTGNYESAPTCASFTIQWVEFCCVLS